MSSIPVCSSAATSPLLGAMVYQQRGPSVDIRPCSLEFRDSRVKSCVSTFQCSLWLPITGSKSHYHEQLSQTPSLVPFVLLLMQLSNLKRSFHFLKVCTYAENNHQANLHRIFTLHLDRPKFGLIIHLKHGVCWFCRASSVEESHVVAHHDRDGKPYLRYLITLTLIH